MSRRSSPHNEIGPQRKLFAAPNLELPKVYVIIKGKRQDIKLMMFCAILLMQTDKYCLLVCHQ